MFRKWDKRFLTVLVLLGGLCFFPLALPTSHSVDQVVDPRFTAIPFQIGDWAGQDTPVDELTYQILETRNILSRYYRNSKEETVHLLLVGSSKDRRVAHPPEVCYTSSHYAILESKEGTLEISGNQIPIKHFVAQDERNPKDEQQVLYLYKVGKRFTTNYYTQQLQFAWDSLTRRETQVLLIRLAGSRGGPFQEFLSQILPYVS
ncbi:MAG: EpsI family protein [Candidatus Omnitrophica bacterium]|nr:EpsI family protein [Candidatus Omnitrophota bacterium]